MTRPTVRHEPTFPSVSLLGVVTLAACTAYIGSFAVLAGSTMREGMSSPLTVTVNVVAAIGFVGLAFAVPDLVRELGLPRWLALTSGLACAAVAAMAWALATVVPAFAGTVPEGAFENAAGEPLVILVGVPKMVLGLVGFGALGVLGWRRRVLPRALAGLFVVAGAAALVWPYPPGGILASIALLWLARTAVPTDLTTTEE